ncbi:MAG: hypothetical protein LBU82_05315 [Treponema sp.]|jgi:hypothetical protein|nr:hypothetical protein [Treponema sp.]
MNCRKVNVHIRKAASLSVKKKLRGNKTWGREYMSFCLQKVDDKTLELVSDDLIMERKLLE